MITLEFLQLVTYFVFVFSIIAYATLDGFDLGVGSLHLLAKGDNQRRLMINAIGPVWDGNTTWIVIGGGVLFAGFPRIFANLTSSLYGPTMLLLLGFMMRGAAIEFRSKNKSPKWRHFWDCCFSAASILLAILVGLLLGNLIQGLPLNYEGEYEGGIINLLTPYPLLVSIFGLSMFLMHGSLYLLMKTEGDMHERVRRWTKPLIYLFLALWAVTTLSTLLLHGHMISVFFEYPWLSFFPLASLLSIGGIFHSLRHMRDGFAFLFSCLSIVFLMTLYIIGTFPHIVLSTVNPENSLTLYNSSASRTSLFVMGIIGITGIPLSFFYGTYLYRTFKGKVKLDHMSY